MGKKSRRLPKRQFSARSTSAVRQPGRRSMSILLGSLAVLAALILVLWLLTRPAGVTFTRTADQNVLLVTLDTVRADALGCYGSTTPTPNLDRLAALGLHFDFAHAHAVTTLPSHASILTGLYPFEHGVHDNAGFRLAADTPTLASLLQPLGFATGAFIGAFPLDSRFGLNTGFDTYDERYGGSATTAAFRLAERRADAVVAAAVEWIGHQRGRWLAWVHLFDPHAPYEPPPPFDREYASRLYDGEVAYTDSRLAGLFDAARDPSGRPTLVIVTGDHGEALGDHGEATHGLFAYESTLRIPLILAQIDRRTASWTNQPLPGRPRASSLPARHVDLVPTILDALNVPVPPRLPGRTLLPDSPASRSADRTSYFEALSTSLNRGWAPLTGVLAGRQKYIDLPLPELYDLAVDPGETRNVVEQQAATARTLEARLRSFGASAPSAPQVESAEVLERLRSLGYVTGTGTRKARYTAADDPKRLIALDQAIHRAVELAQAGHLEEAVSIYQQIIQQQPDMELAYSSLAVLQWEMGQPDRAITTLKAAIQAGRATIPILTKLGNYLAESGHVAEAIPLLEDAIHGDFPDLDALNALGIAYARSGRTTDAARAFRRMLELNPSNVMALENLGSLALAANRLDEARAHFTEALKLDPRSAQAHNGMGAVELKAGRRGVAISHWQQAVASDPRNFDALYNLATELVNDGRLAEARPYLERFARTAPRAFYASDIQRVEQILKRVGR